MWESVDWLGWVTYHCQIVLDHMNFSTSANPSPHFLSDPRLKLNALQHLEIRKCQGTLDLKISIGDSSPETVFESLAELQVEECGLDRMPLRMFARTPNLKRISLANNKITKLRRIDFEGIKRVTFSKRNAILETVQVEALNIAGNLLSSSIENGSLSLWKDLKTLEIGEHNYASEALLREIGQLENLEVKLKIINKY